jgi:hypothetical protein
MSLLEPAPVRSEVLGPDRVRRGGPRPVEALALGILLFVGWLVSGPGISFMSDEGQAELQVDLLRTGTWFYDSPFDERGGIDEDRAAMALRDQGTTDEGAAPYGKHPVYPVLLRLARSLAGDAGTVLVSMVAAVAAAWLASVLARELGARDPRPAFWLCGLASPLFFDGMIVFAHTSGAALAAVALLALVRLDRAGPGADPVVPGLVLLAVSLGTGVLLRNEVFLLAGGIALAVVVAGGSRPGRRLLVAGVACGAAGVGWWLDRSLRVAVLGAPDDQVPPVSGSTGSLAGRLDAAHRTLVEAGAALPGALRTGLLVWSVVLGITTWAAVRRPARVPPRVVAAVGVAGLVLHLVRLVAGDGAVIPGLVAAFPAVVVVAVLLAVGRPGRPVRLVAAATAVTGAAVVMLQYDRGGGLEWGGRFFALLLPGLAALVTVSLQRSVPRRDVARGLLAVLCAVGVLTALGSVSALRGFRAGADAVGAAVVEAGALAGPLEPAVLPEGRTPKPLVVTPEVLLPQILRPVFAEHDWLAPDPAGLAALARRLDTAGVDRFVLVTADAGSDLAVLARAGGWIPETEVRVERGSLEVVVVARDG